MEAWCDHEVVVDARCGSGADGAMAQSPSSRLGTSVSALAEALRSAADRDGSDLDHLHRSYAVGGARPCGGRRLLVRCGARRLGGSGRRRLVARDVGLDGLRHSCGVDLRRASPRPAARTARPRVSRRARRIGCVDGDLGVVVPLRPEHARRGLPRPRLRRHGPARPAGHRTSHGAARPRRRPHGDCHPRHVRAGDAPPSGSHR